METKIIYERGRLIMAKAKAKSNVVDMATVAKVNSNQELFNLTKQNIQQIGKKKLVYIPLKLLFIDSSYQRNEHISKGKITGLVNKWNDNKMDPLRVSIHPEENRFAIIDGCHRYYAANALNFTGLECEVMFLSEDPTERRIQEATLFATQNDETDKLTPLEKHKANCLRGIKENITLQKMIEKYDIALKPEKGRGRGKIGHLAGFSAALQVARISEQVLDDTFNVIGSARWNLAVNGYHSDVIRSISSTIRLHPAHATEVVQTLVDYCIKVEPEKFMAESMTKYPERKTKEAYILTLEDKVCEALNIPRVYFGGDVKQAIAVVTAA